MKIKLCYFNQHWNIYLYTEGGYDGWMKTPIEITKRKETEDSGEFRLRTYECSEIPIYSFGFMIDDPRKRPGHGGEWSSNSTSINKVFDVNIYEVAVDQISVAVPMEWLKEKLGDRVKWEPDDIWGEWIVSVEGHENEYMKWIEL